jgi:hypothetical protein
LPDSGNRCFSTWLRSQDEESITMGRLRYAALGTLLLALLLVGCNPLESTNIAPVPATGEPIIETAVATESLPTAEPPEETALPATVETSAATAIVTGTAVISPTPGVEPGVIQEARIVVNAAGELEPQTITATVGITLALTLINRTESDALLVLDLPFIGAAGVILPGTLTITGTAPALTTTPAAGDETTTALATEEPTALATEEPTARLILQPTGAATSTRTAATSPAATAARTTTPGVTATPAISGSQELIYLRFDQPGTYEIRCAASAAGETDEPAGCTGSVEIVVAEPGLAPTPQATRTLTAATAPITGTAQVTGTAQLTATPPLTTTAIITRTSAPTTSTAEASPEATGEPTVEATPGTTATP